MTTHELRPWGEFLTVHLFPYVHTQAALIRQIIKHAPPGGKLLEIGYGSGWTAILLADLGYEVWGLDIDAQNYRLACHNAERVGVWVGFCLGDLFHPAGPTSSFDVGFSDGVFEHFSDAEVIQGLQLMKDECKTVIMDVPSWKLRHTSIKRGDEIYRTNQEWRALIRRAGFTCKQMYGSVLHCPKWYRVLLPALLSKWFAPHVTTKVGFVL